MYIHLKHFIWTPENIEHIARHGIEPLEVEETCYRHPLVLKGASHRYYLLGQTEAGRYLFVVMAYRGKGRAYTITARDMTPAERRRYERR